MNHRIEIEEGAAVHLQPSPSPPPLRPTRRQDPPPALEPLPAKVETWLIDPLKAPEFSLPDLDRETWELQSLRGSYVLLNFWAQPRHSPATSYGFSNAAGLRSLLAS